MDDTTKQTIVGEVETACRPLREFCAVVVDIESGEPGSGVWLKIGQKIFIATAGHIVRSNPNGKVWVLKKSGAYMEDGFPSYVNWNKIDDGSVDIGYLELNPAVANQYFSGLNFVSISQLHDAGIGRSRKLHGIVGAPRQDVQTWERTELVRGNPGNVRTVQFSVITYLCDVLPMNEWPQVLSGSYHPDGQSDMLIEYPSGKRQSIPPFDMESPPLTPPHGMSGGGIWDFGIETGELWNPELCRLVGIQHSFSPQQEIARGTQISHLVSLIESDYPDLRNEINAWKSLQLADGTNSTS
jgi:hypothetical protein